jgi:hypothetical protein
MRYLAHRENKDQIEVELDPADPLAVVHGPLFMIGHRRILPSTASPVAR